MRDRVVVVFLAFLVWGVNGLWLMEDTRPPVWDMALHQSYALNYLPTQGIARPFRLSDYSGNYPPFVHLAIALCFLLFHPGPHIAVLCNLPATLILFWAIYELARELCGHRAACWTCFLLAVTPYLVWMSRETILDYWLSAWVAAALLVLLRTRGFASRKLSLLFGVIVGCGLLTKWLFAGFAIVPTLYICFRYRVWRDQERVVALADSLLVAGCLAGTWYLPNIAKLVRYFADNARIGELEGEPAILSFQSAIYYLRLLEGYQLFGILFLILCISVYFVWRKKLLRDGGFLVVAIVSGWLAVTLLRTKDPRFTLPLLGQLLILPGAWIQSWSRSWLAVAAKALIVLVLGIQIYASNFGIRLLPQEIILARGYQGSLRWDWNLYLQHYFHILGPPRREDWKQKEILLRIMDNAKQNRVQGNLAVVPDMPRFNAANFNLQARLMSFPIRVDHPQSSERGVHSFDGFNYVVMTEGDQGMPWTTLASRALNQIIVDEHQIFRLVQTYTLPNGDGARLYLIQREARESG